MRRESMRQAGAFARRGFYVLAAIFFFGLTVTAARSAEPESEKTAATVEVRLSEYAIEMPHTLAAGPTAFLVHNEGKKVHSFKIEGPGIDEILSKPVQPKATGELKVTLQPGEYKIYCPVGSHEVKGMTTKLVVTAAPSPAHAAAGRP
ncbi:MAG: cupredoxin domain-containing protein [Thermoanaerobaculia bacterium]